MVPICTKAIVILNSRRQRSTENLSYKFKVNEFAVSGGFFLVFSLFFLFLFLVLVFFFLFCSPTCSISFSDLHRRLSSSSSWWSLVVCHLVTIWLSVIIKLRVVCGGWRVGQVTPSWQNRQMNVLAL